MTDVFNTTNLAGNRVLVTGTKKQRVILDATCWRELQAADAFLNKEEEFNETVADFFAPITEAADEFERFQNGDDIAPDPAFSILVADAIPEVAGRGAAYVELDTPSAIVRLIEIGLTDRLIWVGDDTIEILAQGYERPEFNSSLFDLLRVATA